MSESAPEIGFQVRVGTARYRAIDAGNNAAAQRKAEEEQKDAFRKEWKNVEAKDWLKFGRRGDQMEVYICPPKTPYGFKTLEDAAYVAKMTQKSYRRGTTAVEPPEWWLDK